MSGSLNQLVIFYHVFDLMGFSKAAEHLGVSKAYVSKQISQLESTMNVKLLERNTRRMKLTFAGEQLFIHSRNMVMEYQRAEQTIAELQQTPKGVLRVTSPPAYAAYVLAKKLPEFLQAYPDIHIDLKASGQPLNLIEEKINVAIRLTHNPPLDYVAKHIGQYELQVCATSSYLKQHALIKKPQDLTQHACLVYSSGSADDRWSFTIDQQQTDIYVDPRLSCNTYEPILAALQRGEGIARLPSYVVADLLEKQQVQLLLSEYAPVEIPVYAVYAQDQHMPPMTRVFVDFLLNTG